MKTYQKVEMLAKNAPSGSYAAGCPQYQAGTGSQRATYDAGDPRNTCINCECTK